MFIYINGDSHTAGIGLGDYKMFPNYPGNYETLDKNRHLVHRRWLNEREEIIYGYCKNNDHKLKEELNILNRQKSWAGQLGKILNAEIFNNAHGGSSMFSIYIRTIRDLNYLISKNKIPDYVFIGLTTAERIPIITEENLNKDLNVMVSTILPTISDRWSKKHRDYAHLYWDIHSDKDLLIFYFYQCIAIRDTVKAKIGKDVIFLNTCNSWTLYMDICKDTDSPLLKELWNELNLEQLERQDISLSHFGDKFGYVADGHYLEEAHLAFANLIAEKYIKYRG